MEQPYSREPTSFANPKVEFAKVIEPHCQMTAEIVAEENVVLCVGDTTFLDYDSIVTKREGYGPIGNWTLDKKELFARIIREQK